LRFARASPPISASSGVVLPHLPVALADLDDLHVRRQRVDLAVDRHAQNVRADADQGVVRFEQGADLLLVARRLAEEQRMLGREMRARHHGLLIDRRAQGVGEGAGLVEGVAGDDLVAGNDQRLLRRQQHFGERPQRLVGGPCLRVDARRLADLDRAEIVQDVAGQRDEDGPGRLGHRHLRGAVHGARKVGEPRHLGRPLHDRARDRHQRRIEQRFGEAVALFLLTGRDDQRRAGNVGGVERAHGVAQARRHMDVARRQLARRADIAVRHRDHDRFLQAERVAHVRIVGERMHHRQFGSAGIAEHLRHALAAQEFDEGVAAADPVGRATVGHVLSFLASAGGRSLAPGGDARK
jgi:hypothetical protein